MVRPQRLAQGQAVRLRASGFTGIVGATIGSGGQGTVYHVDVGGRRLALKWFHPGVLERDTTMRDRIARLVGFGAPDRRYLWPLDIAGTDDPNGFGYVMPLMSGDRRPLQDLIAAPPRRMSMTLEARAVACFEVAESFQTLHAAGLCYQDVNFGAFFVDPIRGSVLICDADNITTDGRLGGVYGTRKFMAPEVMRRAAFPSTKTDLHSMAVLFFYVLFGWHPLDGRRETEAMTLDAALADRLYGTEPLFVFDPSNKDNGPVPGTHDWIVARWTALPHGLRALFTRAFTAGLRDPNAGRVIETEWLRAFARLRDLVVRCSGCTFEVTIDDTAATPTCSACGRPVGRPARMQLPHHLVAFLPGCELHRHHIEPEAAMSLGDPVGRIDQHPTDATILGLRNLTPAAWRGRMQDGKTVEVTPGRTIRVVGGLAVEFGRRRGEILEADAVVGAEA